MQLPNLEIKEKQIKATKLTKEKSAIKRGNKPQAPLASGNILSFCGRKRYAILLARGPRHQRRTEKLTSAGCRLTIQPTPTEIGIRKAHQNQRRIRRVPVTPQVLAQLIQSMCLS